MRRESDPCGGRVGRPPTAVRLIIHNVKGMATAALVGLLFLAIALVFFTFALRDYVNFKGQSRPGRRTWLRIGIIFTIVGLGLQFAHRLLGP